VKNKSTSEPHEQYNHIMYYVINYYELRIINYIYLG